VLCSGRRSRISYALVPSQRRTPPNQGSPYIRQWLIYCHYEQVIRKIISAVLLEFIIDSCVLVHLYGHPFFFWKISKVWISFSSDFFYRLKQTEVTIYFIEGLKIDNENKNEIVNLPNGMNISFRQKNINRVNVWRIIIAQIFQTKWLHWKNSLKQSCIYT
jgi:hypothetical protein